MKIKTTITFINTPNKIKYLAINLVKHIQDPQAGKTTALKLLALSNRGII